MRFAGNISLVASSPHGDWVVVCQALRPCRNSSQRQSYAQSLSPIGPLPAAFVSGQRLVYVAMRGGSEAVVVRELATRKERVLPVGSGKLWSLAPLGDQWLSLRLIVEDVDHNGRLDPPRAEGSYAGTACSSPVSYMSKWMLDHEPGREEESVGDFRHRFGRGPLHWYLPSP